MEKQCSKDGQLEHEDIVIVARALSQVYQASHICWNSHVLRHNLCGRHRNISSFANRCTYSTQKLQWIGLSLRTQFKILVSAATQWTFKSMTTQLGQLKASLILAACSPLMIPVDKSEMPYQPHLLHNDISVANLG